MPITSELHNVQKLRDVGFTQQQGFEKFADVLERGLAGLRHDMALLESWMETRIESSLRDQTLKMIAVFVAPLSLAVAVIKLFPGPG